MSPSATDPAPRPQAPGPTAPASPAAPWCPGHALRPHTLAPPSVVVLPSPPLLCWAGYLSLGQPLGQAGLQPCEVGRWGPQGVTCTPGTLSFGDCPLCPCLSSCNENSYRSPVPWEIRSYCTGPRGALLIEPWGHGREALSAVQRVHACADPAPAPLSPQE